MRIVVSIEHALIGLRQAALHTSAASFGLDFAHACFGRGMIFYQVWYQTHELAVSYAAFAATIVIYIDTHREKRRVKREMPHE